MKKTILIAAIMFVLLAAPIFAACDNSCASDTQYSCSLSTSSMWKDSKATLTVAITNQQSQAQSVTATLLGDWFIGDVISIAGNTYNQGQAKTLDFSVTPSNDGSQPVCVRMGTTCSADCGLITINSNADLSVPSLTTSVSSVSTSGTFTASATIQNSGTQTAGSTTAITATLSGNSYCTVSSGTKTVGTISGKSSTSQSWTVTAGSSAGTCSLSLSVTGTPGGSATKTASVTVSAASTNATTTSSSGGGGGGGGGGGSSVSYFANTAIAAITSISANSTQAISIRNATASDISTIAITTNNRIGSATLTVLKIATKPSGVSDVSGNVYRYIQIDKTNITDSYVTSVKITFFVENSWITANNIDDSTIALYRYANGAWTKLSTTKTNADSTYTYYEATSPGLSVFAIIGEKKTTTPPAAKPATGPVCGNNACESGENYQSCPQDCPKPVLCGNGVLDPDEECEGTDVPGQTCETRGYTGGTLKCTNCRVDESQCITKTPLGEMTKETWDMSIIMVIAVLVIVVIAGWFYCHGKHAFPKRKKNPWER